MTDSRIQRCLKPTGASGASRVDGGLHASTLAVFSRVCESRLARSTIMHSLCLVLRLLLRTAQEEYSSSWRKPLDLVLIPPFFSALISQTVQRTQAQQFGRSAVATETCAGTLYAYAYQFPHNIRHL